ncbi:MAG: hypothetical protein EBU49_05115, partial [Proteobacteria bacterium]|nr:hypothetical protein [Pseudomonadota bacterium]
RTQLIAYLVTAVNDEGVAPVDAFKTLREELAQYSPELAAKPVCVILSKIDLIPADERNAVIKKLSARLKKQGFDVLPVSSVENNGIDELKRYLYDRVQDYKNRTITGTPTIWDLDKSALGKIARRWLAIPGVRLELTEKESQEILEMQHPDIRRLTSHE